MSLSDKKAELQKEFDTLKEEAFQHEQRLQEIATRMTQLQGAYQLVGSLEKPSKKKKPAKKEREKVGLTD